MGTEILGLDGQRPICIQQRALWESPKERTQRRPGYFWKEFFAFNAGVTAGYSIASALGPGWRGRKISRRSRPIPLPSHPPPRFPPPLVEARELPSSAPATLLRLGGTFVAPGLLQSLSSVIQITTRKKTSRAEADLLPSTWHSFLGVHPRTQPLLSEHLGWSLGNALSLSPPPFFLF